ncbi:MAG: response regulator transcription factor [Prolixibacteraceae bacterium]|nr:response regulator transcription factor [Prolixibacteraceae bacterium]
MTNHIKCLIVDDEKIAREILETHLSKIKNITIMGSCKDALDAFQIINNQQIDLIFLDINMPELSGLSFAKTIKHNCKIIFTTAYREYAIDGFDLQAVDYLLKPISFERLLQAVNKYIEENTDTTESISGNSENEACNYFFVRSNRKMVKIVFNEILYVESLSDYVKIHMVDKTVITRETITNIEAKLPQKSFLRVHRSFIVSIQHIVSFSNDDVFVKNHEIPISRSYKNEVINRLENT